MRKIFIIFIIFIFWFQSFWKIFANNYESKKSLTIFNLWIKKDDSREKLLSVNRWVDFVNKIDEAINNKKNNRKYLEKVLDRVERVKYSTFLKNETQKETFKAIIDYLYFLVLYTLENTEEKWTWDLLKKIFTDID